MAVSDGLLIPLTLILMLFHMSPINKQMRALEVEVLSWHTAVWTRGAGVDLTREAST